MHEQARTCRGSFVPSRLSWSQNVSWSPRATYVDAVGSQHARVLGVERDLHEGRERQLLVGEALPKVVGDEDPRALTSGHHGGEDDLQKPEWRETSWNDGAEKTAPSRPLPRNAAEDVLSQSSRGRWRCQTRIG